MFLEYEIEFTYVTVEKHNMMKHEWFFFKWVEGIGLKLCKILIDGFIFITNMVR